MSRIRIFGIVIAVVGALLLAVGLNGSHSLANQASQTFLGRYTHDTMTYIIVGIAALVGGGLTALAGRR
jgi:drug/metabolite transporter (DMT)-like permease